VIWSLFALLGLNLTEIELELLSLEHVTVGTATLSGSGGNGCEHTTSQELILDSLLDLGLLLSLCVLLLVGLGPLAAEGRFLLVGELGILLATERDCVVRLVPLTERSGVDDTDSVLDEGFGTDQLVVAGVVHHVDDTGLPANGFATPGEVSLV